MKKILGLTIAAIMVLAMIGGGTYALFSDTETSNGNTWAVGTLNLVAATTGTGPVGNFVVTAGGDGINGNVVFTDLIPGDSGSITWTLTNTGNTPGTLTMLAATSFNDNLPDNEAEHAADATDAIGLAENLMVWVTSFDGTTTTNVIGLTGAYVAISNPVNSLVTELNAESNSLVTGTPLVYVLYWKIPNNGNATDNVIQGDSATLNITFTLNQTP